MSKVLYYATRRAGATGYFPMLSKVVTERLISWAINILSPFGIVLVRCRYCGTDVGARQAINHMERFHPKEFHNAN